MTTEMASSGVPPGPGELSLDDIRRDPLAFLLGMSQTYGGVVRYRAAGWDATLLTEPGAVQHVLQDNARNYLKEGTPDLMMLKPMLGNGLLTSEGAAWVEQRRMLQPAFRPAQTLEFAPLIDAAVQRLVGRWRAREGDEIDVVGEMTALTLEVVAAALFGYDVTGDSARFGAAVETLNETMGHFRPDPELISRFRAAHAEICGIVAQVIAERRLGATTGDDVLAMMLGTRDESGQALPERLIAEQILTLLLAGHETTAKAMSWTLYLLATHPAEAMCVRQGADYPWMAIQEAMRLYPPIWLMSRVAAKDDWIGEYLIPERSLVTISPWALHRDPRFWPDPGRFDPHRFAPGVKRPHFAYIPFSGGPRQCIGRHLAGLEMNLAIAAILRAFDLELVAGQTIEPEALVTLRPRYGLRMRVRSVT